MDQGHDCSVLMLQTVGVTVAQCVVIFDDPVAANLAISKKAKKRDVGEHFVEGVGLHVDLVVVVILASPHTGEHEP